MDYRLAINYRLWIIDKLYYIQCNVFTKIEDYSSRKQHKQKQSVERCNVFTGLCRLLVFPWIVLFDKPVLDTLHGLIFATANLKNIRVDLFSRIRQS